MKTSIATIALLFAAAAGCAPVNGPVVRKVSGTVHHMDGRAAGFAKVWTLDGRTTLADARGRYAIVVHADSISVTVIAREAPRSERIIGDWFGRARVTTVSAGPGRAHRGLPPLEEAGSGDIVLDMFMPI